MEDNFSHRIPLIDKSLEPIKEHFIRTGPGPQSEYRKAPIDGTVMLRLDWKMAYYSEDELKSLIDNPRPSIELMILNVANDLADLLVNGDVNNCEDALLKTFSGEIVRNQEAAEILIPSASYYREVSLKRQTVEYTMYLRFGAKFKDPA